MVRQPFRGLGLLAALAALDAVALPGVLLMWVWHLPGRHGGFFGALLATLLLWWAFRRAWRAFQAPQTHRWTLVWVLKIGAFALLLRLVIQAFAGA
jgi:hypothetical protein